MSIVENIFQPRLRFSAETLRTNTANEIAYDGFDDGDNYHRMEHFCSHCMKLTPGLSLPSRLIPPPPCRGGFCTSCNKKLVFENLFQMMDRRQTADSCNKAITISSTVLVLKSFLKPTYNKVNEQSEY